MESLLSRFANFSPERMQDVGPGPFLVLLVASVLSSLVVTVLYQRFYSSRETGSEVYLSFPLLGLSVTAIFITIQFSLPLSLGLLGALSIVRFRTAIKAPEEIGFIMLLVACSLACATFNLLLLGMMLGVAWLTLVLRRFLPGGRSAEGPGEASLLLTVPADAWRGESERILTAVRQGLARCVVESVTHGGDDVVLTMRFRDQPERVGALESALRAMVPLRAFSAVFHRPGGW